MRKGIHPRLMKAPKTPKMRIGRVNTPGLKPPRLKVPKRIGL